MKFSSIYESFFSFYIPFSPDRDSVFFCPGRDLLRSEIFIRDEKFILEYFKIRKSFISLPSRY